MHITGVKVYSELGNVITLESCSSTQFALELNVEVWYSLSFIDCLFGTLVFEKVHLTVADFWKKHGQGVVELGCIVQLVFFLVFDSFKVC